MHTRHAVHPPPNELAAFALGKLPEAEAALVAHHLEVCPLCAEAVKQTPADSFLGLLNQARPGAASNSSLPAGRPLGQLAPPAAAGPDLPPELVNHPKFHVLRRLGQGGMGTVYHARHKVMDRDVALKVINPAFLEHPDALPRFFAEVKAAARLDHPHIVRAYDAEPAGGLQLFVMEYVEGHSLAQVLKRQGPLPVAHACHYIRQAALGLQHAFEMGMAHRDVKPDNLMLTPRGMVKILDFGLARLASERAKGMGLTQVNTFMGTPEYVAPEQATDARQADIRADLYSLGCTLYCLLAGRPPFQADTMVQMVLAHRNKEALPLREVCPEVPEALSAVVARLLAKDPAQRYQQPVEVAQALAAFVKAAGGAPSPGVTAPGTETRAGGDTSRPKELGQAPPPLPENAMTVPAVAETGEPFRDLGSDPAPKKAEKGREASRPVREAWWKRPRPLTGVGAAVLALVVGGWLLAGVIFKIPVKTAEGQAVLVLEIDQPGAEVFVDGQKITVKVPGDKEPVEIAVPPGKHVLEVKKGGFVVSSRELELKTGKSDPIKLRLEPAKVVEDRPPPRYTNSLGMKFALVPRGKSWLGGGGGKPGDKEVEFKADFYLGVYEVTQEEWQKVMGNNPSCFLRGGRNQDAVKNISDLDLKRFPVENVSWHDAQKFLTLLNAREQAPGWTYRLPKEAEWEYACRGGPMADKADSAFDFYLDKPTNQLLEPERANFKHGKCLKRTCKVGTYPPNRLGLYDMHGNVIEWCADEWFGTGRRYRGGCWSDGSERCRAAFQFGNGEPASHDNYLGLRVARVPVGKTAKGPLPPTKTDTAPLKVVPPPASAELDAWRRDQISPEALALAGAGDPRRAPASLVGVLGEILPFHSERWWAWPTVR